MLQKNKQTNKKKAHCSLEVSTMYLRNRRCSFVCRLHLDVSSHIYFVCASNWYRGLNNVFLNFAWLQNWFLLMRFGENYMKVQTTLKPFTFLESVEGTVTVSKIDIDHAYHHKIPGYIESMSKLCCQYANACYRANHSCYWCAEGLSRAFQLKSTASRPLPDHKAGHMEQN